MEIKSTNNLKGDIGFSAMVYGKSGIGKTYLATILKKPVVIDLEGGVTTLKEHDIPYLPIRASHVVEDINKAIKLVKSSDFETIIFDSYTMLESILLTTYARESKSEIPTLQDYGKLIMKLQEYLLKLRDLRFSKKNVVVTALEQMVKVEESDSSFKTMCYPLIMAKKGLLIQKLVGDLDIVAHLEHGKNERFLRVDATEKIFAKSRIHDTNAVALKDLFTEIKNEKETEEERD